MEEVVNTGAPPPKAMTLQPREVKLEFEFIIGRSAWLGRSPVKQVQCEQLCARRRTLLPPRFVAARACRLSAFLVTCHHNSQVCERGGVNTPSFHHGPQHTRQGKARQGNTCTCVCFVLVHLKEISRELEMAPLVLLVGAVAFHPLVPLPPQHAAATWLQMQAKQIKGYLATNDVLLVERSAENVAAFHEKERVRWRDVYDEEYVEAPQEFYPGDIVKVVKSVTIKDIDDAKGMRGVVKHFEFDDGFESCQTCSTACPVTVLFDV